MAVAKGAPKRGALLSIKIPRGRGASLGFYIARRILWLIPVLLFVITITYFLSPLAPGSPWDTSTRRARSPPAVANLHGMPGLHTPLPAPCIQYTRPGTPHQVPHLAIGPPWRGRRARQGADRI